MSKITIALFIDALGWRIQDRHHFLDDLLTFKKPLDTVFGYSSTCAPTILTGLMPREHGHFAFYRYQPDGGAFPWMVKLLGLLPGFLADRGRVRSWISKKLQPRLGWDGYFQLYGMPFRYLKQLDYTEKKDLFQPGGINGGQRTFFQNMMEEGTKVWVSNWRDDEVTSLGKLEQQITQREIDFAYLYWAKLDGVLHEHGVESQQATDHIRWYERQIRDLVALAKENYDDVQLCIFSDHGMADIHKLSNLLADVEALGYRWGKDYASVFDATVARFWFHTEEARRDITALLDADENGRILTDQELADLGCDFPEASYGELFYLVNPGILLCPSHMGKAPLAAMHGYHPDDPDSTAMFGALTEPKIHPGGLADLAQTMMQENRRKAA